jgi:prevent-host-death family protein
MNIQRHFAQILGRALWAASPRQSKTRQRTANSVNGPDIDLDHRLDHYWLKVKKRAVEISVTDAKAQLTDLVRRAEAGEDIVLTRHGQPVAKITGAKPKVSPEERRRVFNAIRAAGRAKATPGPSAARSQDFLYDDDGAPK